MGTESGPQRRVVVTLATKGSAAAWLGAPGVAHVVTFSRAAPNGKRFGHRLLGLGVDSAVVALFALRHARGASFLATNPWIAIALRIVTSRPITVTGLYATPGSRYWRLLRRFLSRCNVVTLSTVEAENWVADGGRARSVLYGNTFPYPVRTTPEESQKVRVFVGGTSDRDRELLRRLEAEILASGLPIELDVAVGIHHEDRIEGPSSVRHHGELSQPEFGALMASSDITYLPLIPLQRAAGHMILVGSLQVGTPVVVSGAGGMEGYIDGTFVRDVLVNDGPLLPALLTALEALPSRAETHDFWKSTFSKDAYMKRVSEAALLLDEERSLGSATLTTETDAGANH